MRLLCTIFIFFASLFGMQDATMVVSNEALSLPKLKIIDKSGNINQRLKDNFYSVLKSDFKVTAAYELDETNYDFVFEYSLLQTSNSIEIKGVLKDKNGKQIYTKSLVSNDVSNYVFLAHNYIVEFAKEMKLDDVSWMNQKIIFAKKISSKKSSIVIADYTLSYQKPIITTGLNLFPKWADNAQSSFYYSDYSGKNIVLYRYDILTGKKEAIMNGYGMLVVTDVSKDGGKILVTMAPNDQPDIYLYNVINRTSKKITDYKGIDVSGKFIKNDSAIVFVSDRLGYPNVFMQDIGSFSSVKPMVFKGKNNSSISAYDNYIVYSSREDSATFNLYLMSLNTDYIRQLTLNGKNVFPNYSHNGNSILFLKHLGNQSSVVVLRIEQNLAFSFALKAGLIHSFDW